MIGPRVPASPSIKKAQAWAVRQFEEWGLENVAVEPCGEVGPGWSNEYISVHLTEPSYARIIAFPKPFTSGTDGPIEGQPVIAVIKTREDMEEHRGKLEGAIVFVDEPREIEISFEPVARRLTENDLGEEMNTPIPVDRPKKDEVVMLGGHLDSWTGGTGAVDNGAGCAVTMEAMRILKELGVRPRRTIRAALWTGEETSFYGSIGYVRRHFGDTDAKSLENPDWKAYERNPRRMLGDSTKILAKPDYHKISCYYNFDNGSGKIRGIYLLVGEVLVERAD